MPSISSPQLCHRGRSFNFNVRWECRPGSIVLGMAERSNYGALLLEVLSVDIFIAGHTLTKASITAVLNTTSLINIILGRQITGAFWLPKLVLSGSLNWLKPVLLSYLFHLGLHHLVLVDELVIWDGAIRVLVASLLQLFILFSCKGGPLLITHVLLQLLLLLI